MRIKVFFGKTIEQRTANYPWMDYAGYSFDGLDPWAKELGDGFWNFYFWLCEEYKSERVDKKDFSYLNKTVLVIKLDESIADYAFFKESGKLAELYRKNQFEDIYKEYLNDKK